MECQRANREYKSGYKCPKGSLAKLGDKNPMYGKYKKEISYAALHDYIKKRLKMSNICQHCGEDKKLDLANKSQNYLRDITDWLWLCRRCHLIYDDNMKNLENGRKPGYKFTDEQKRKLSESHKGQTPWNKGKTGLQVAWNKGIRKTKNA